MNQFLKYILKVNSVEPDQTPRFVASDLVLHCLPMSHNKDARLNGPLTNKKYIRVLTIIMIRIRENCPDTNKYRITAMEWK